MQNLVLAEMKLQSPRSSGGEGQDIDLSAMTVVVGANNSGKSLLLREIKTLFEHNGYAYKRNILGDFGLNPLSETDAESVIHRYTVEREGNNTLNPGQVFYGNSNGSGPVDVSHLKEILMWPERSRSFFCANFLRLTTVLLNGENRMQIGHPQGMGDLRIAEASFTLRKLFLDDKKRDELRRITYEAFGKYFVIDPTAGSLRASLSSVLPKGPYEERGLHDEALAFHRQTKLISEASDGIKAFVSLLCEVIVGEHQILLIDEPEAFLYPPLAHKLGVELSQLAHSENKNLFCATHSSSFLSGCLQAKRPVNIIRLSFDGSSGTARILRSADLIPLMRDPLLRSVGVLDALFYDFVVVTEADSDRALYQEVNDRLLRFSNGRGIPNCLFLNAQNKQTIRRIITPLRNLGIPVVGIFDIDILKDDWSAELTAFGLPEIERRTLGQTRSELLRKFKDSGKDMKKVGIAALESNDQQTATNVFERLAEYGLFVIPTGEAESWFPGQGMHGSKWLINVFESFGDNPDAPNFVRPENGGVWRFIDQISVWLKNPMRKGIPA